MEGPAFSTRAESQTYRKVADLINMSTLPEAKLARELEISYQVVCMATDYDCWHQTEEGVSVEAVIRTLKQNAANAAGLLVALIMEMDARYKNTGKLLQGTGAGAINAGMMRNAVITSPLHRNKEQVTKLEYVLPGYF